MLQPEQTNIHFSNTLSEGLNTNVLMYEYFYNGGGVATGDLNGDGLEEIYFTSNMEYNKLYLNNGSMNFWDISKSAGVEGRPGPWKTGTTFADVNGDGLLDIFLCYSGNDDGASRTKQLFINTGNDQQGIPHFIDSAKEYGLADTSYTTQSYFFDFDRDGDLDLLLLNHNIKRISNLDEFKIKALLTQTNLNTGVELYQNNDNHFFNYTKKSGLKSTILSHGLSAGISDINDDGWLDIYLANDYLEPDYLYINQRNGTFSDSLETLIGHTSYYSMGCDVADVNNDGLSDLFTLDMLPKNNYRQKTLFSPDNYESFNVNIKMGFHYQYMRNMLQLNNGNGSFSEIGQLSGISNTDWSWAPLFADFDNDGLKDLFVSNGYLRDYTNMDFLKYMSDFLRDRNVYRKDLLELVNKMPSSGLTNYFFKNNGDLTFADKSATWSVNLPSNSGGAAYADLDNDGDLDLIVNNINQDAFVFENNQSSISSNNYLNIRLEGLAKNKLGIGAKVYVTMRDKIQMLEQMPTRGFQSSVSPVLHFGLGTSNTIDTLKVVWPSGKQQFLFRVNGKQVITLKEADAVVTLFKSTPVYPLFKEVSPPFEYANAVSGINDFKRQPLLINPLSFAGPCLVKGDVNGDGLEDIYAGGGNKQSAVLFIQLPNGKFIKSIQPAFETDSGCEDADAVFLDANSDGFTDIYVASGGYHNYLPNDSLLQDRLYFNDGHGRFIKEKKALPPMLVSKSCVRVADIDEDGYPDLFIGGRTVPGRYPETPESFILINDGKGHFTNATAKVYPLLKNIGMVSDAAWIDFNGDNIKDLVIVGEWMPITLLINNKGRLENKTSFFLPKELKGWWNKIDVGDFNKDGKPDLLVGNMGLNTQFKVSEKQPAELYYKDFDNNGSVDPFFCFYINDTSYPYVTRDELFDQLSVMRTHYPTYKSYASETLKDIFSEEEMHGAARLDANCMRTVYLESGDNSLFHEKPLPVQVQFSPVFTITQIDYDGDGNKDLLMCGNLNQARIRFGKYDANYGCLLHNDGKGNFSYVSQAIAGFNLTGDIRSVLPVNGFLLFGINQQKLRAYKQVNQ